MEEKRVCCCSSGSWAKVIAWLHIIGSFLGSIGNAYVLVSLVMAEDKPYRFDPHQYRLNTFIPALKAIFAVMLVLQIAQFIMAIVLIRAMKLKTTGRVAAWIVFTILVLIIQVIALGILTVYSEFFAIDNSAIVVVIVTIILFGIFSLYVVWTHKNGVDAVRGSAA